VSKSKQKPRQKVYQYIKHLLVVIVGLPFLFVGGFICTFFTYIMIADTWAASFEAERYPDSVQVHDYWRGGSGATYNYYWYCTTDSIEDVSTFYESYGYVEMEYPTRIDYHFGSKSTNNALARLFTHIATGTTPYPPEAYLAFWRVIEESTDFEREICNNGILIEIGSGYAD